MIFNVNMGKFCDLLLGIIHFVLIRINSLPSRGLLIHLLLLIQSLEHNGNSLEKAKVEIF